MMSKYEWDADTRENFEKTKYKRAFIEYMDDKNIHYSDVDDFCLAVTYGGENMKSIKVFFMFDKDGDAMLQLSCMEIASFKNNEETGIAVCNEINAKYRWVKFYVDGDGDVICDIDAYLEYNSCAEICMSLLARMVKITDEVYPSFMRALWAN